MEFSVEPESEPPTNIHVLIGRNGVGKTYLLNHMTRALVQVKEAPEEVGHFEYDEDGVVVSVQVQEDTSVELKAGKTMLIIDTDVKED